MTSLLEILTSPNVVFLANVALFFSLVLVLPAALFRHNKTQDVFSIFVLLVALCVLGAVAGFSGGTSREGVVGDIIPAALALAAGLSIYLFGLDASKGVIASICLIGFASSLLVSYIYGAQIRGDWHFDQGFVDACRDLFMDPRIYESEEMLKRVRGEQNELLNFCNRFWRFPEVDAGGN